MATPPAKRAKVGGPFDAEPSKDQRLEPAGQWLGSLIPEVISTLTADSKGIALHQRMPLAIGGGDGMSYQSPYDDTAAHTALNSAGLYQASAPHTGRGACE